MTGLPWWASIPSTTLAMRFALLPLTLKAKSAALNWVLLQNSFQTANNLLAQIQQQQQQQQQQKGAAAAAGGGSKALQALSSPGQQQQSSIEQLKRPSKLKLVRSYYRYFRKQQRTTSMWWWVANAAVQVSSWACSAHISCMQQCAHSSSVVSCSVPARGRMQPSVPAQ
jgi:hypothetical protein